MTVESRTVETARGDVLTLTLIDHPNEAASVLITIDDPDGSYVPTAELTIAEAGRLREELRILGELVVNKGGRPDGH